MARPCDGRVLRARPSLDDEAVKRCEAEAEARKLTSQALLSGSWLASMPKENLRLCQEMAPKRAAWGSATLTWGSMCSGSEGPAWVLGALNQLFEENGSTFRLQHAFSCEVAAEKRKWIHASSALAEPACARIFAREAGKPEPDVDWAAVLAAANADAPCVFFDICEMGAAQADCWEHGPGTCCVPSVDLLIAGTSCKDMSRANSSTARNQLVFSAETSKGGSAQTFHGLMQYVERHRPLMVLFENVDSMEDVTPGKFSKLCFACQSVVLSIVLFPCLAEASKMMMAVMLGSWIVCSHCLASLLNSASSSDTGS